MLVVGLIFLFASIAVLIATYREPGRLTTWVLWACVLASAVLCMSALSRSGAP